MLRYSLIICALVLASAASATHIIGGNLKVEQVSANSFLVDLAVFRDCGIGDPNDRSDDPVALQSSIIIRVYDALNYAPILTETFSRESGAAVNLGNSCYSPPNLCVEE